MAPHKTIIIGAGASGIAMSHTLKFKLGYTSFEIYEKREGLGGTWRANTYPGCGSDVAIHLYSFSFNLNPNWTEELCDQEEILNYMESTVDKFGLRPYIQFNTECLGAKWSDERQLWDVTFLNLRTKERFVKSANVLLTAVGGFSQPRVVKFPGMEKFKGRIFHTAEWDHSYDYTGKRMAVIGNGCSAAQVVPNVAPRVAKLTQYARSAQWYHARPNHVFTRVEKACFNYVPLLQRYHRLKLFMSTDNLASVYGSSEKQVRQRVDIEQKATEYIRSQCPEKYHSFIVPDFPLGCKRRIFDPGYLKSLHNEHVDLLPEGIKELTETGIVSESGLYEDFDVIVLATGFQVQNFLAPMEIIGKNGKSLHEQWASKAGAQAYMGTYVHNFPNFAMLFGPNTFPAFNSVIYAVEVQVEYIRKSLMEPTIDGYADVVEVCEREEESFVRELDKSLADTVFAAGCSNWYINTAGRNSATWPGLASSFWAATFFPKWKAFSMSGGSSLWLVKKAWRQARTTSLWTYFGAALALAAIVCRDRGLNQMVNQVMVLKKAALIL
ncbi:hypothetical protein V8C34DRAFT_296294 [Trichoderma compactum]